MSQQPDPDPRYAALESRVDLATADAKATRHLAAARDRDLAEFATKIDANRSVLNALGEQTRARFDAVDRRFDAVDRRFDALTSETREGFAAIRARLETHELGFAEIRGRLDGAAAGLGQITEMLTTLVERDEAED